MVHLQSDLVTGTVPLGVRTELPVDGVSLILGNDLAGGKVFPSPVVVDKPGMAPILISLLTSLLCFPLVL